MAVFPKRPSTACVCVCVCACARARVCGKIWYFSI